MSVFSTLLLYAAILIPIAYVVYLIATSHVVRAVFARNVMSYFSGILGYLFIVVFVVVAAILAFNNQFFTANLANLDQLTKAYPLLLLFIVPAITMTVWSEERKQGTDELLFTLPANDVEILLGKYLAVVAVYSVALVFSMTLWCVLAVYSDPGFRMFISTYLGYWLVGASLLAVGMFASALTRSATVAFVLGAIICAVPVFLSTSSLGLSSGFLNEGLSDVLGPSLTESLTQPLTAFSIGEHLHEFSLGVVRLSSVLYFESLAALFLYLNLIVISERHWSRRQKWSMGLQYAVRSVSVLAILISLYVVATQSSGRADVDLTPQKYFTLSDATTNVIDGIEQNRPVTIQAFISPEVPGEFVRTKRQLEGLLRQIDQRGGSRVSVRIKETTKYSPAADEAKSMGIEPQTVQAEEDGKQVTEDVFMGVVVGSSYDEVVVPFVGVGTPIEYELTRSLRTVSNAHRLTVGVLETEAHVMTDSMRFGEIVSELRRQYNVESVIADSPIEREKQLFTIEKDNLIKSLQGAKKDKLPADLQKLFADEKAKLSEDYTFKINKPGELWTLTDKRINRKYTIKRSEETAEEDKNASQKDEKNAEKKAEEKKPAKPKYAVYTDRYDVVLAVLPSTLTPEQMGNFVKYVKDGGPTLIFDDPLPMVFLQRGGAISLAPRVNPQRNPHQPMGMPPAERADDGKATSLMKALNLVWDNGEVVWDLYNPYPEYEDQSWWRRGLFTVIGEREIDAAERISTINQNSEVTKGLNRFMLLYAGTIRDQTPNKTEFTPLIRTGRTSGVFKWEQITNSDFGQTILEPVEDALPPLDLSGLSDEKKEEALGGTGFRTDPYSHIVAARIRGKKDGNVNAIYVADCDLISNVFFDLRRNQWLNLNLDNVSFVLNAVDSLAGEKSFLELRRRKPPHPSLTKIEEKKDVLRHKQREAVNEAKAKAIKKQEEYRRVIKNLQDELRSNSEMSLGEKYRQMGMTLESEQRRLQGEVQKMNDDLKKKIDEAKTNYEREVNKAENRIRLMATVLPALPAIILGLVFLSVRMTNERREISPDRRR